MNRQFDGSNPYASNHRTAAVEHRTAIEPAPVAGSIKALAQRVLTRGSASNSASNHDRTDQFDGHRTEGGSVRTKVRTPDASSMAQGCSDRTDRTSNYTNFGQGYMHPDGGVETGQPDPMPRPVVAWAADLTDMVNRVATFYEWSNQDRQDFIAWACRSAEGLADARAFIETEAARLPAPGLLDRRRVVLDMLADDPAVHCTWTLDDTGTDPVMLVIAVRDVGTAELAIPRTKFDALALPMLIAKLTEPRQPAAGNT